MKITKQQEQIIESILKYRTIKINAFAGTGKATTLKLIANRYYNKKILYLAFNNSIKQEALGIFPNNTEIKTTHGLAYFAIKKYTNIDLNKVTNYRAIDIAKTFEISYNEAIKSLKIFEAFCNNTQQKIEPIDNEHKIAKHMFDMMLISKMAPTHSFYLKYYYLMLSSGQISQFGYDIIMLDEAQDTNDVTIGIFEALKSKVKIYTGDKHQQIYSFRGSKNALEKLKCNKELYLSCSFRFDNKIASYANKLLKYFKNEKVKIDTIVTAQQQPKTFGYISRTNASLILIISKRIEQKKPFVTIRNPTEIFSLTIEVYYILQNKANHISKHLFLKEFKNETEILEYANEVEDFELKSALSVAKEYKQKLFELLDIASKFYKAWQNRAKNNFDKRIAEILFLSTAHTSKGLEWDCVTIADDFVDFADIIVDCGYDSYEQFYKTSNKSCELIDEFNLFYVAITRAKYKLHKDSLNFHYLMSRNTKQLINSRIKENKQDLKSASKFQKISKISNEDKITIRQQRNIKLGKPKNSGLKWSDEDKQMLKKLYKNNMSVKYIASLLHRTPQAISAELSKSGIVG